VLLPSRIIAASFSGAADVIKKTFDGEFTDACHYCGKHHYKNQACCEIPETECPSPYVCDIHWHGCPGDKLQHNIQVNNTGKIQREFNLTAAPFPCTDEVVAISNTKKTLAPGESLKTIASFSIPESFAGSQFKTVINVAGAYEQFITVYLHVEAKQDCCCFIEQGEIPNHIKAHHWYHHFQCEEECFEPVLQRGKQ